MGLYSDVLLAVDFDRTLTAPDSSVPQRNLEAIRYFTENGGAFTVNTGRSVPMTRWFRDTVPVNAPLLLFNGAAAYDVETGELFQIHAIEMDQKKTIEEVMALFPDLTVEIQAADAHYTFAPNRDWETYNDNNLCAWAYAAPGEVPGPFLKFTLYGDMSGHTVASMFNATEKEMQRMQEVIATIERIYGDKVEVCYPANKIVDVQAKGISKLTAARQLQKSLGKKILVCVGDALNDVAMLDGADYAFCPVDGVVADRYENVCKCADGAVADVILEKIPEILRNNP